MLSCLGQSSSSTNTQTDGNTPISSDQTTPSSVNLTKEYAVAIQSASYSEIWSKVHYEVISYHGNGEEELQVEEVLKPSRECVKDALSHMQPYTTLSQIVINYFEHSEQTTQLCLSLARCIHRAHQLYSPLHKLLDLFSIDFESPSSSAKIKVGSDSSKHSLTQPQCAWAFDAFKQFVELDNPFPSPHSHSFGNMHSSFTQLKHHLDIHLQKSRSKVQLLRGATKGAAVCLIVTTVGVVITATVIAAHALVALVASPICPFVLPSKMTGEEMAHLGKLDDAAKGIFVFHNHLETVDCLVARLHNAMEDYNRLVRFGIDRGGDSYPIQEVVFQLRKRHDNFIDQLNGLEEHLCICLAAINRARSLLLNCFRAHHYHPS